MFSGIFFFEMQQDFTERGLPLPPPTEETARGVRLYTGFAAPDLGTIKDFIRDSMLLQGAQD